MVRVFESCGWEYTVLRPLRQTRQGGPVLLAARRPYLGGETTAVELRPLPVTRETATSVKARLAEELQLSKHLRSPHFGGVLGFAVSGERPYLVAEHVPGCSLESLINAAALRGSKLSAGFAVAVAMAVADALDHAHHCRDEQGQPLRIVHRAVSPANIWISRHGRVQLVNFAAAYSEWVGRQRTPPGLLRGDAAYSAPEVLRAFQAPRGRRVTARVPPDPRADLFSLGLVLLETLTAVHPLDPPDALEVGAGPRLAPNTRAETTPLIPLELLAARLLRFGPGEVERAASRLPRQLHALLARALQAEPAERYPSARAMAEELRELMRGAWPHLGEAQVAAEAAQLLRAARKLHDPGAYGALEDGVLPEPADVPRSVS